jgi:thiol-disulfide isomerase/thioredoxin
VTGIVVAVAVLLVATVFGVWHNRRDGRLRTVADGGVGQVAANPGALPSDDNPAMLAADDHATTAGDLTLRGLGVDPATPVTLVQFSSAFCAPCRVTRRVLADVAGMVDGVTHLEVDAESHLDAVRALDIWRTPTTLVVANGRIVQRASGVPAKAQVLAAIAPMLDRAAR